jgi:ABC-2 type transport system permease protein
MKRFFRLYLAGMRVAFMTRMADRTDFFASLLVMLGIELLPSVITVLVYGRGLAFPGWRLHEAVLLQAVFLIAKGLTFPLFAGMAWSLAEKVREGTFELVLLKPRHPLVMCVVTSFDAEDVGKLIGGLGLTVYCLGHVPTPTVGAITLFMCLLLFSVILFAGCLICITASLMIWVGNYRIYEIFDSLAALGQYPPVFLPKRIRQFALAPVPLLGFAVLPASALLGRSVQGWPIAAFCSILLLLAAIAFWNYLVRRLASAGG